MSFPSVPDALSAMPLAALPAVALDTETTGLDAARDRIVELGAVRLPLASGSPDTFEALINPGLPIPPEATAIHGIGDRDVAGAPAFPDPMARLVVWAGASVVIGHSIGFDIAILEAEHRRHGLVWRAPRSLDVRHLAFLVDPSLSDLALDAIAGRLGFAAESRHRALADAMVAARIFSSLLPRLRLAGIVTLAEAERAILARTRRLAEETQAGWHAPRPPAAGNGLPTEYSRIDSYPYRHEVGDVMHRPPLVVDGALPLRDALPLMVGNNVSSLFVDGAASGRGLGIVTERDVLRAIEARGEAPLPAPVEAIASFPLITIDRGEFVYRALGLMARSGFRHLGVTAADGTLVGALSARDLLRQRADEAMLLGDEIERAANSASLGHIWAGLYDVVKALAREEVRANDIAAIVSRELRALTRRAAELAEAELVAAGLGPAPVPCTVIVLGSGGRGESLLAMDQDNALIWRESVLPDGAETWFERFGKRIADLLDEAGVAYCKGGVMASNAAWRGSLELWRRRVGDWITRSRPEDLLNSDIFFDAAPVWGDDALAGELLAEARAAARSAPHFLRFLARGATEHTVPVGWFGRLKLVEGRIDLKAAGIMPIFSAARAAALGYGIAERATPARLGAIRDLGKVSATAIDNLIEAHRILLDLVLRQQLRDIERGLKLSNSVAPSELDSLSRRQLKWAIDEVPAANDLLGQSPMR